MDEKPSDDWFDELRGDLSRLAHFLMEQERDGHTMQTGDLLQELWIKLSDKKDYIEGRERAEVVAICVEAMRRILIDYARGRNARKRGGDFQRKPLLDEILDRGAEHHIDMLDLDEVMTRLAARYPLQMKALKMHLITGLSITEIAALEGVSHETIRLRVLQARTLLLKELKGTS